MPTEPREIDGFAHIAGPNLYPFTRDSLRRQKTLLSSLRELRQRGIHLFPMGIHQTMPDIAELEVAMSIAEEPKDWRDIQDVNGLIISRGVTTLGAFGMAASEVVQKAGNVFMSFPRTKTLEKLTSLEHVDMRQLIDSNNYRMRSEIKDWLKVGPVDKLKLPAFKPGMRLFSAWSGTTDTVRYADNHQPEDIQFGKVHAGLVDIVKHGLVLPVVMWDRGEEFDPILEMGELTTIRTRHDISPVQEWQRATLAARLGLKDDQVRIAA